MDELRVPTVALMAEIALASGRRIKGELFRSAVSDRHEGPPRPDEWANGPEKFFPFRSAEGNEVLVINKSQLAIAQVTLPPEDEIERTARHQDVVVECSGGVVKGTVLINLPEHHQRLLDFMNQPEQFISIRNEQQCYLINKNYIIDIKEAR